MIDPNIQSEQALNRPALPRNRKRAVLRWLERMLLAAGLILLAVYGAARIDGWVSSGAALQQFDQAHSGMGEEASARVATPPEPDGIDFSLWSHQRIRAFMQSFPLAQDRTLVVLALDRLRLRVLVFERTGELVLNRGAG